jgi:hypothetical protein
MSLRHQRAEVLCFSLPLVPAVTELLHPVDVRRKEFLHFARFFFPYCSARLGISCSQVLHLDAQPRYFPTHLRHRIGRVRRLGSHEVMDVRRGGMIRHAEKRAEA